LAWIWPNMFFKFTPLMLRAGSSAGRRVNASNLDDSYHHRHYTRRHHRARHGHRDHTTRTRQG
jgi:hypothetical protein